jgi:hypothetical protein
MAEKTPEELGKEASDRLREKIKGQQKSKVDPLRDNPPAVRGMKEKHHTQEGGESTKNRGIKGRHRKD